MKLETRAIHGPGDLERIQGAVVTPIFQSSTYECTGQETSYDAIRYLRLNNSPSHLRLHRLLASLEGAEEALVTSSGMAAISTTLLSLLKSGDHLLVQKNLYGGTHSFITQDLPLYGITWSFIDATDPQGWQKELKPETRLIYVESMSNPTLCISDLGAVLTFAKKNRLTSVIDNTFASPVNFSAIEFGFDLSLHSATKYLNGHSDLVAGAILGRHDLIEKIAHHLGHLGGCLDPHACFLLERGIRTLVLRVRAQNETSLALARFLENHPKVAHVYHPGLPSHPHHERAKNLFQGFGGVVSFELKEGVSTARQLLQTLYLPVQAVSLGGIETLITIPAQSSHKGLSPQEQRAAGLSEGLIRVAVGIEAQEDLIADFKQALSSI